MLVAVRACESQVSRFIAAAMLDSGDVVNLKANE